MFDDWKKRREYQTKIAANESEGKRPSINEALCKVLCHNLCVVIQSVHELGIEAAFPIDNA